MATDKKQDNLEDISQYGHEEPVWSLQNYCLVIVQGDKNLKKEEYKMFSCAASPLDSLRRRVCQRTNKEPWCRLPTASVSVCLRVVGTRRRCQVSAHIYDDTAQDHHPYIPDGQEKAKGDNVGPTMTVGTLTLSSKPQQLGSISVMR